MSKSILYVTLHFITCVLYGQLTVSSENNLSTAPIFPNSIAADWGDIDGNGNPDIVSEIADPGTKYLGTVTDLLSTANFTAQDHIDQENNNFYGNTLADLDGDGDLDLITTGPNGTIYSPNNIYYWNADSSRFEFKGSAYSIDNKSFYGRTVVTGDFNNDTKPDVMWFGGSKYYVGMNATTTTDSIKLSSITASSTTIETPNNGNYSSDTGDFNNDGNLDVITVDAGYYSGDYGGYYQLLLGNGDSTFSYISPSNGTDSLKAFSVAAGDVNADGKSDFVLVRSDLFDDRCEVIIYTRNSANTGFEQTILVSSTSFHSRGVVIDDINNDSYPDILLQTNNGNAISIFLNQGDGTFPATEELTFYPSDRAMFFVHDVDGAGYKDVITLDYSSITYYSLGLEPDKPVANDGEYKYDGTEKSASADSPSGDSIVWYTNSYGSTTTNAPTATNVGTYSAYAAARDTATGFESSSRTLVTLTIDKAPLSVTNATAADKTYDGNTEAAISGAILEGVVGSEDVSLANDATGTFASANPGTAIAVSTSMTLEGADKGNYTLSQPALTADISARELTVTNATAADKTYDGNTEAAISGAILEGVVGSEDVSLANDATGTFASANPGTAIAVSTSMTLEGADKDNYTLSQPALTADITKRPLGIKADPNQSKIVGTTDPDFTYTITSGNLVNGDKLSGKLSREKGETVGSYQIKQGTLSAGDNYEISFVGAEFEIVAATDINTHESNNIRFYPNPTNGILYVDTEQAYIKVFDMNGTLIFETQLNRSRKIDISNTSPGAYLILLTTDNGVIKHIIMKK
ncbi:MAG: T9SS type A sorting domain-containing protein [Bacteroidetes bacterium]|nr:T9SS type A sorting domain-containing protein [Bacteroidota bacterium]